MHAVAAAIKGVLRLVPFTATVPVRLVESTEAVATPRARSSGFRRPSAVGPLEENTPMVPLMSAAPQVIASRASAGAASELVAGSASCPMFPAELMQTSPLDVAMFTAIDVGALTPSMSACVYQSLQARELVTRSAPCASMNSNPAT